MKQSIWDFVYYVPVPIATQLAYNFLFHFTKNNTKQNLCKMQQSDIIRTKLTRLY